MVKKGNFSHIQNVFEFFNSLPFMRKKSLQQTKRNINFIVKLTQQFNDLQHNLLMFNNNEFHKQQNLFKFLIV